MMVRIANALSPSSAGWYGMRRPVAGGAEARAGAGSEGAAAPGGAAVAGARSGVGGFIAWKVTASSTFWLNHLEGADAGTVPRPATRNRVAPPAPAWRGSRPARPGARRR